MFTSFSSPVFTGTNYGLVPRPPQPPSNSYILASDGTWVPNLQGTLPTFTGIKAGIVPLPPQPPTGTKILLDNATWVTNPALPFTGTTTGTVNSTGSSNTSAFYIGGDNAPHPIPVIPPVFTGTQNGLVPHPSATAGGTLLADNGTWVPRDVPFTSTVAGNVNAVGASNTSAFYIGGDNAPHAMPTAPVPFTSTQNGLVTATGASNTSAYYIGGDNAPHPVPVVPPVFSTAQNGLVPKPSTATGSTVLADNGTWVSVSGGPPFSGSTAGIVNATGAFNTSAYYIGGDNAPHAVPVVPGAFSGSVTGLVNATGASNTSAYYIGGDNAPHAQINWIGRQIFNVAGTSTYTPTAGTNRVFVRVIGGGGGSGGTVATSTGQGCGAAGGGPGGYVEKRIVTAFSGVTITVGAAGTAGAAGGAGGTGGTSSFGALISATGGTGGGPGAAVASPAFSVNVSSSGLGSSGDVNTGGVLGSLPLVLGTSAIGGNGGSLPPYGSGGRSLYTATSYAAQPGTGYGAGASGPSTGASQAAIGGGSGTAGAVIVDEYA